jgi:hypothetical protein
MSSQGYRWLSETICAEKAANLDAAMRLTNDTAWRIALVLGLLGSVAIVIAGYFAGDGERYPGAAIPQGD